MENRMVKIMSMSTSTVVVARPEYNIRRVWSNKGQVHVIPFEVVEQLLWGMGFRNMIESGTLYIENMQDKIDLGLEEEGTKTPTRIKVLNDAQILTLLKIRSYDEFMDELSTLSIDQVNNIVDYAAKNEILDSKKIDVLKALTGRDVIKIIARNRENAEIERKLSERNKGEGRRV